MACAVWAARRASVTRETESEGQSSTWFAEFELACHVTQSLLRVDPMLGARLRHDFEIPVLNTLTTGQEGPKLFSPVTTYWAHRMGETERWGGRGGGYWVRCDHLLVIGASDDPPRSRSGLRDFGNTRLSPIVKMLATQIQSTRAASITPTTTHSISHPRSLLSPVPPRPPAHPRIFHSSCCSLILRSSTYAQMRPRWPCACNRYSRSLPQPKNCVRQFEIPLPHSSRNMQER